MRGTFLGKRAASITPYVPGEQPKDMAYIKLNTNENPYPPAPGVLKALAEFAADTLRLYPDMDSAALTKALAEKKGLDPEQVLVCGGSDEALAFAFMAFCDEGDTVCFPDITYGFYPIYASLFGLSVKEIALTDGFAVKAEDYFDEPGTVFLANPNAPTGILLGQDSIEEILRRNPSRVVVVDEAYIDFAPAGSSCTSLINRYDNLLVVQTFSKSRSLAGMRLGAAYGNAKLIDGMNRIKYSFNPYNLDRVSQAVGIAAVEDEGYMLETAAKVVATREWTAARLREMGFDVLPSSSNFLFVRHPDLPGKGLYESLKRDGILVRYFDKPRISDHVRISVGTDQDMRALTQRIRSYL